MFIVRALPPRVTYSDTRSMWSQGGGGGGVSGERQSERDRMRESERERAHGGWKDHINQSMGAKRRTLESNVSAYIHFRIGKVVEQNPTPYRNPLLGPSVPPWPPTSRDVGPPTTR